MITNYPYRDYFYDGDKKKNILIVPQGTQVIPREGKEPKIKVYDEETHTFVNQDNKHQLKFYITNHNIVKEQFSITESINSPDDLAFGSCEPGQVKFTIRNEREIDPDGNVVDIVPPLTTADLDGAEFTSTKCIFKLYVYFNDDSSTMLYIGMYKVEEDKMSADQKSRDIVAYDYLYELRDMDISNWYKRLFTGTTTATNDKKDEEEESNSKNQNEGEEEEESEEKEEGGLVVKNGKEQWTILEALTDLFKELCTNDSLDENYPGYGLKMWFDESVINSSSEEFPNLYKYAFTQNKNFIDKSYSLGKFFEDIGVLIGAYPKITRGVPGQDGWCDQLKELKTYKINVPNANKTAVIEQDIYVEDYCILAFVPLANKNDKIDANHVIKEFRMLKGISSEAYAVGSVNLLRAKNSEGKIINHYTNISDTKLIDAYNSGNQKTIEVFYEKGKNKFKKAVIIYDITNNLFLSHLGVKFKEQKDEKTSSNSSSSTTSENNTKSRGSGDEPTATVITKKNCKTILQNTFQKINRRTYTPFKVECIGDLCIETGDRLRFRNHFDELYSNDFKSYVLIRTLSGIQKMVDKYEAKGSNGLPNFGNYKSGASYDSGGYAGSKVSDVEPETTTTTDKEDSSGNVVAGDFNSSDFVELIRNIGYRLLDEPEVTKCVYSKKHKKVFMRWSDPADITTNEPLPAEWVGTVVVRKEGSAPLHRWDGTVIVDSQVRDQYKNTSFEDITAENDKDYYYGFFPYHLAISDSNIPVYHYRFTKVMHVVSEEVETAPKIKSVHSSKENTNTTTRSAKASGVKRKYKAVISYELPEDNYEYAAIVIKENSDPESATDGRVVDISSSNTSVTVRNLNSKTEYHYKIFTSLNESNEMTDETGGDETIWEYGYTGQIETFTAPVSGTYKIEAWGAQGANAIDGEVTARGGYGSYSCGEVFLVQGETIYVNVGGQNGYGGGGTNE